MGFGSLHSGFTTMVDIRSIAGSSRPSRHGQGFEHEATSHSREGRSRRTNACDATTAVVATAAAAHRQHSAAMVAVTPPGASSKATMETARRLLHNPPSPHASPSVAEQWCHDIDQLIISRRAAGKPPWWGTSAVSGTLTLTNGATHTSGKSCYGGFVG
jgi:hypothetical protein